MSIVIPNRELARTVAEDLRNWRKVSDFQFDQLFPSIAREHSKIHWTPVEVAARAAEWLAEKEGTRILDVGSGCGKFCIVGALTTSAQFTGVEYRGAFVEVAQKLAQTLEVKNATFIHANLADLDWTEFDSFYFFNPFLENVDSSIRMDHSVALGKSEFDGYVQVVRTRLSQAKVGTQVATYYGFGGEVPSGYLQLRREPLGTGILELWTKVE